jgi:mannan endo-1,4-beta-mannosidase
VNIHSYSGVSEFATKSPIALQHALAANKLVLFEEFGATGASKAQELKEHIDVFNGLGVPWMPWQISKPGNGEADYEFWVDEESYDVVKGGVETARGVEAAQGWPGW